METSSSDLGAEMAAEGQGPNELVLGAEKELERLEGRELEGSLSAEMYPQLLAAYLIHFDFRNAQLFWKRSADTRKEEGSEFREVWKIAQRLWQKDFPGAYKILKEKEWSTTMKPYSKKLEEAVKERAVELMEGAYSAVKASSVTAFMDFSSQAEAVAFAETRGWKYESGDEVFVPKKISPAGLFPNVEPAHCSNLENLTQYVTFLEN